MEAPILSKKQQHKAIKKKKIKKSIRHVLSKPKTLTWPEISENDSKNLKDILKNILYFKSNVSIDWKLLKNIPRDQRKEERENIAKRNNKGAKPEELKNVIFGINAITRGLEKKIITSVLISSDVNPVDMIRHIWHSCDNAHIPIIAVPNLRHAMKEMVGFPVLVMGLKKTAEENPLHKVYEKICDLDFQFTGRTYPYTETINLDESLIEDEEEIVVEKFKRSTKIIHDKDIYLYRTSEERCFVPPTSNNDNRSSQIEWSTDFLAFTDMETDFSNNNTNNSKPNQKISKKQKKAPSVDKTNKTATSLLSKIDKTKNIDSRLTNIQIDAEITPSKPEITSNSSTVKTLSQNRSQTKSLSTNPFLDDSIIFISEDINPSNPIPTNIIHNPPNSDAQIYISEDSNSSGTTSLLKSLNNEIELREKEKGDRTVTKSFDNVVSNVDKQVSEQYYWLKNKNAKKRERKKLRNSNSYLPVQVKRLQANPNRKKRK